MNTIDQEIDLLYSLWVMTVERKEWFRDARKTRKMIDQKHSELYVD